MKKIRLICAIGAALLASSTYAKVGDTFTEGQFKYKVLSEQTVTENGNTTIVDGTVSATNKIAGYDYSGDYVFPETVNHNGVEYVITTIGNGLFKGYEGMTSITIPSTIKEIGDYCFQQCQDLNAINLSNGLTKIGIGSFSYTAIEDIDIPNSVTEIGHSIVQSCSNLKTIKFGKGLKTIGKLSYPTVNGYAASGNGYLINYGIRYRGSQGDCPNLEKIIVDSDNPYFCSYDGDMYSKDMTTIVMVGKHTKGDVTVPESVTKMYDAIWQYTEITSLTLPDGITQLGIQMCGRCTNLTEVNIPSGCSYIPFEAFIMCYSLPKITIPDGVEVIDLNAFKYCKSLRNIKIPNSCRELGSGAFAKCYSLTHVTLPSYLKHYGQEVLGYCNKIREITIPAYMDEYEYSSSFSSTHSPSLGIGSIDTTDPESMVESPGLKAIYIMGDYIPNFIYRDVYAYKPAYGEPANVYVKKSVFNNRYSSGTSTYEYTLSNGRTRTVTIDNIGWMVPITMGTAADQDGVNYKTLCRDFDADFTDPEVTESECRPFYAADVNYERTWVAMQQMRYVPCRTLANVEGYEGVDAYHGVVVEGLPGKTYYYRIGEDDYTLGADGQTLLTERQEDNMMRGANDDHWTELTEAHPKTGEDMTNYGLKDNKFRIFTQIGWLNYNKSYLSIPTEVANSKSLSLAFEREDGTTRIVSAESFTKACDDGSVFNLQGQKVDGSYKGIVIKNGKKYQVRP